MSNCQFTITTPGKPWDLYKCSVCGFSALTDGLPIRECEGVLTYVEPEKPPERRRVHQSPPSQPSVPRDLCTHRGDLLRIQSCKPCQANGKSGLEVFSCSILKECTDFNSGVHPKIQGCITCERYQPLALPRAELV